MVTVLSTRVIVVIIVTLSFNNDEICDETINLRKATE
jgi:hypothetical protein